MIKYIISICPAIIVGIGINELIWLANNNYIQQKQEAQSMCCTQLKQLEEALGLKCVNGLNESRCSFRR